MGKRELVSIDEQISGVWWALGKVSTVADRSTIRSIEDALVTLQFLKKHQVTVRPFIQAAIKMGKTLQAVDGGGAQD